MKEEIYQQTTQILKNTHDGDDLAPEHLKLVEMGANGVLNKKGEKALEKLHKDVLKGYKKPFYHGIEHMTQDLEGYIYWKGIQVEHYSFTDYDEADKAAKELESRCKSLESKGIKVSSMTAIWKWEEYKDK